jgi:hypothetical protein
MPPGTDAVAHPDSAGAQQTAQLTAARQVDAVPRAEREILRLARQVVAQLMSATGTRLGGRRRRAGEPVVRIGPRVGLLGVHPRGGDLVRKQREPVAATLADGGERDRVPGHVQRDLVGLSGPVAAGHGGDREHGAIDAA